MMALKISLQDPFFAAPLSQRTAKYTRLPSSKDSSKGLRVANPECSRSSILEGGVSAMTQQHSMPRTYAGLPQRAKLDPWITAPALYIPDMGCFQVFFFKQRRDLLHHIAPDFKFHRHIGVLMHLINLGSHNKSDSVAV